MSSVRVLLCGIVAATAFLAIPSTAHSEWNEFHYGTLGPGNLASTCCFQLRYSKLVSWSPGTKCAKTAYWDGGGPGGVEYYIVLECDGYIQDNRDSGQSIGAYCKNTPGSPSIFADCYTCINTPGACP